VRDGYVGVAPLANNLANIALVIDEKVKPSNGTDPKQFLLSYIQQTELGERIKNLEPIVPVISAGPLAFTVTHTSGNGTILIGDTCGFIDPFTGEGINYAFLSASIASEVLDRCFRENRFDNSALMDYDTKREQILGRKFKMAHLLQKAVHSPRFSDFLVRRFSQNQTLADTMVSAVGSAIPVDEVWNLSFLLRVVFGGAR
jgi:menaquinone-9 beta-reductase